MFLRLGNLSRQRGDTIIEVLLSVSILGLVLAMSFTSSSRSLNAGTDAANRNQALAYAREQVELLRAAANNGSIKNFPTNGTAFCIDPATGAQSNVGSDGACHLNGESIFGVAIKYNTTNQSYNVSSSWQGVKEQNLVSLYYQTPVDPITTVPDVNVTISASPSVVAYNGSTTISWTPSNAASCQASGSWSGAKSANPSPSNSVQFNNLKTSQIYTITCQSKTSAATITRSAKVYVSQLPSPVITFNPSPQTVYYGNPSTLTWSTVNAVSCQASGGWSGSKPLSGSQSTGNLTATTTFTLNCVNSDGVSNTTNNVTVYIQPAPVISYFYASPNPVYYGGATTYLYWSSSNASSCYSPQFGWLSASGYIQTGGIYGPTGYSLNCYNGLWSNTAQTTVHVPLPSPVFVSATMRWNPSINNNELHFESLVNPHNVPNSHAYWQDATCPSFQTSDENLVTNNNYNAIDRTIAPWSAYYCGSDTTHYFRVCAYNAEGTVCSSWNRYSF